MGQYEDVEGKTEGISGKNVRRARHNREGSRIKVRGNTARKIKTECQKRVLCEREKCTCGKK